ncbi:hypothetical protein C7C46_16350 [Streptomyces tateyamensis]|uniref:Uncharacterized protein n=1 Tax=Streptomyces tateyamensis TaxID=565073 RepID=A0A2V4NDY5_9ACTN|nr:hypothetical protein [Streptomyces tateyamensis]PYC78404.1 hypothetical protein C7C46_16350 [Streptomyces tateyamensis]
MNCDGATLTLTADMLRVAFQDRNGLLEMPPYWCRRVDIQVADDQSAIQIVLSFAPSDEGAEQPCAFVSLRLRAAVDQLDHARALAARVQPEPELPDDESSVFLASPLGRVPPDDPDWICFKSPADSEELYTAVIEHLAVRTTD